MKKTLLFLLFLCLASSAFADKYWVGGSGNFSDPTDHWATSSGGSPGAGNTPTSSDNCIFDANSGTGTATIDVALTCNSLLTSGSTLTTITHNSGIVVTLGSATPGTGNKALDLTGISTYNLGSATTSSYSFVSTSTTQQTINTNGLTMAEFTFNGAGGSWILSGNLTIGSAAANLVTMLAGTFETNGYTVAGYGFTGDNSVNATVTLDASTLNLSGSFPWDFENMTGFTFNAGTSTINFTGSGPAIHPGGNIANTFYNVTIAPSNATGGWNAVGGVIPSDPTVGYGLTGPVTTFNNLTITGSAAKTDAFHFATPITVNGTFTASGNSTTNRLLLWAGGYTNILGYPTAITLNGTITVSNIDVQDWTVSPSVDWHAITGGSGNCGGNTGITFTTAETDYWYRNTGNWSTNTQWSSNSSGGGGTERVPLCQDTPTFNANSFSSTSQTVTMDMPRIGKNFTTSSISNSPTFTTSIAMTDYGSLTLSSGYTWTMGGNTFNFQGRSSSTITYASNTMDMTINVIMPSATLTLSDNLTINSGHTNTFTLDQGTLDVSTHSPSFRSFAATNQTTANINLEATTTTLAGTGTIWNVKSGNLSSNSGSLTITKGTSTLKISDTSSSSKSFTGGGFTYNNLTISGGGSGAVKFLDGNTWNTLPQITGGTKTLTFTSGTTNTYNSSADDSFGNGSNLITINSATSGTPFTLTKSQGMVWGNYLSLQDSTALGTGWFDFSNGTNVSDNTGWQFTSPMAIIRSGTLYKATL